MARCLKSLLMLFALCTTGCTQILWTAMLTPGMIDEAVSRSHRTVNFTVVDADTLQPVPNTEVWMVFGGWFRPDGAYFITDATGHAKKRVATNRGGQFEIRREGYLAYADSRTLPDPIPKDVTLRFARAPAPYHVLEVPDGFHGVLTVDIPRRSVERVWSFPGDSIWPRGKRAWVTRLQTGTSNVVPRLPTIGYESSDEESIIGAQRADGTVLPLIIAYRSHGVLLVVRASENRQFPTAVSSPPEVAVWEVARDSLPHVIRIHLCVGTRNEALKEQDALRLTRETIDHLSIPRTFVTLPD